MSENEVVDKELKRAMPVLKIKTVLALIISTACLIVAFSFMLYTKNPNYKYDIARPGEETQSAEVAGGASADTKTTVSATTMKQYIDFLEQQTVTIDTIHDFSSQDLSDENILLTTE